MVTSSGSISRRGLLRAGATTAAAGFRADEALESAPQNANRNSKPADLKIKAIDRPWA